VWDQLGTPSSLSPNDEAPMLLYICVNKKWKKPFSLASPGTTLALKDSQEWDLDMEFTGNGPIDQKTP
jgi:hypothetical protein